jgi:hypothetical protein
MFIGARHSFCSYVRVRLRVLLFIIGPQRAAVHGLFVSLQRLFAQRVLHGQSDGQSMQMQKSPGGEPPGQGMKLYRKKL